MDIISTVTEAGTPRHERAALVGRLRDKHRMKFRQIGGQLHVTPQRAHQLYKWNRSLGETDLASVDRILAFLLDD